MTKALLELPDEVRRARFAGLFDRHQRDVLAFALRRTRTPADAEDAAAETFAIAWRRLDQIPDSALPWLYGVTRRVLANQYRGQRRATSLLEKLRLQPAPAPAHESDDSRAVAALRLLRPDDQELLRLIAWEDLDHASISEVLGISVNAVAIRLHRARQRYREALARLETSEAKGSDLTRTSIPAKGKMADGSRRGTAR